ncbi:MAG: hypothetical protein ACK4IT_10010 [Thioalkalivibrionaceae bacterium]
MIREINVTAASEIKGGADITGNFGALGSIFLDASLPALGALAALTNSLLTGLFGSL